MSRGAQPAGGGAHTVALVAEWLLCFTDPEWRRVLCDKLQRELPSCGSNTARSKAPLRTTVSREAHHNGGSPPTSPRCVPVTLTPLGLTQPFRRHTLQDWGHSCIGRVLGMKLATLRCIQKYSDPLSVLPPPRLGSGPDGEDGPEVPQGPAVRRRSAHGAMEDFVTAHPRHACKWIPRRAKEIAREDAVAERDVRHVRSRCDTHVGFVLHHIRSATVARHVPHAPKGRCSTAAWLRASAEAHWARVEAASYFVDERGIVQPKCDGIVQVHVFACIVYRVYCLFFYFASAPEGFTPDFWECAVAEAVDLTHFGVEALKGTGSCTPRQGGSAAALAAPITGQLFVAWYVKLGYVMLATPDNPDEHLTLHQVLTACVFNPLVTCDRCVSPASSPRAASPAGSDDIPSDSEARAEPTLATQAPRECADSEAAALDPEGCRTLGIICRGATRPFASYRLSASLHSSEVERLCGVDASRVKLVMQKVEEDLEAEEDCARRVAQRVARGAQLNVARAFVRKKKVVPVPPPPPRWPTLRSRIRVAATVRNQLRVEAARSAALVSVICILELTAGALAEANAEERALLWFSVSQWPDPAENPLAAALSRAVSVSDLHNICNAASEEVRPVSCAAALAVACVSSVNSISISMIARLVQKRRKAKRRCTKKMPEQDATKSLINFLNKGKLPTDAEPLPCQGEASVSRSSHAVVL